jgi:flagellar biosynthetic protein FlhB
MSESAGEKTEKPTQRKLEDAIKRGQMARSPEVQTAFVLMSGLLALRFTGPVVWRDFVAAYTGTLGHLSDFPLTIKTIQSYALHATLFVGGCVGPIVLATMGGGLLAGGIQNRFQTASEALSANWEKVNPLTGLQRIFSIRSLAPTMISLLKLVLIILLSYSEVHKVVSHPVFYTAMDVAKIADFLAEAAFSISTRVGMVLCLLAVGDYLYQFWRTNQDLMMTKEEVKEEMKNSEGNQQVKSQMRRRRSSKTQRQMLLEVPHADVIVTNPTHLAVALRYDRKTMKAPRIVAKGSRLNALKIRELAKEHQVPIIENKPLARLMFKYGKVGGEIPAELYAAVAEILAWVYRVNRYRYYSEDNLR